MSDGDSCQSIGEVIFTDKPGLYFVIFAFVVRFPLEGEVRRIAGDVSVDVQPVLTAVGNLVESVGYLFQVGVVVMDKDGSFFPRPQIVVHLSFGLDDSFKNFVTGSFLTFGEGTSKVTVPWYVLYAAIIVALMWFIWNKTTFGKNLFAVGGNPEAAAVSGISVFRVTVGAFVLAGILYGFGSWLECIRMVGSGSAAYGQGWEMDAIAACVVGGVSFTGGIGKISGVVVGVFIFTALTYSLTILGIDTNLQFVFSGIIILVAVALDCLKYVQKK